ncbi:hypothetical protein HDU81_003690 [Chytriomyces hyalinus]|nr:hypothetical protein HDU81_003690 [Chytriomyces hyalinus]
MSNRNIASPHAPPRIIVSAPRGSDSESSRGDSIRRITSQSSLETESNTCALVVPISLSRTDTCTTASKSTDRMRRPSSSKPPLSASNSIESIPTRVIRLSRPGSSQSSNADETESSIQSNRSNRKVKESRTSSRASETTESASESTRSRHSSHASASTITPRTSKSKNASSATPRASDTTYTSSSTVSNVPLPPKYKRARQTTATMRKNDSSDSIVFSSSSESSAPTSATSASHTSASSSTGSDDSYSQVSLLDSRSHGRSKKHNEYIDTGREYSRELLELPPLPSTPVPKGRPATDSKKKSKLKIISPTTGAFVTVADTDLLLPTPLPQTPDTSSPQHPDTATHPNHTAFEILDTEQLEKKEESERIRALLKNSAALAGGRGRTRSSSPARKDTMFSGGGVADYGDGHARKQPVFAKSAENEVGPVIESGDPDILFVDDGGKFRHLKRIRMGETDNDEDGVSFDDQLQRLCMFVAFYSQVSTPTSRLFSVVGTLAVLAALDGGYDPTVGDGMDRADGGVALGNTFLALAQSVGGGEEVGVGRELRALTIVSYVCTIIMVPVDDKLYESQRGEFGGPYGDKDW